MSLPGWIAISSGMKVSDADGPRRALVHRGVGVATDRHQVP
jgi:hypothetical protein